MFNQTVSTPTPPKTSTGNTSESPPTGQPKIIFLSVNHDAEKPLGDEALRDGASSWYCWGIFGFIFILLLLSAASTTNCTTGTWLGYNTWLVCDDTTDVSDVGALFFVLLVLGGLGMLAACWCSRRNTH